MRSVEVVEALSFIEFGFQIDVTCDFSDPAKSPGDWPTHKQFFNSPYKRTFQYGRVINGLLISLLPVSLSRPSLPKG